MVLISSSLIIFNQLDYLQHKGLGFAQDEVIILPVKNRGAINPRFEELQSELLRLPGIKSVTATSNVPGRSFNQNPIFPSTDPTNRLHIRITGFSSITEGERQRGDAAAIVQISVRTGALVGVAKIQR